ncbi:AtzE family amidohydrolase [Zavarzinia sp. CC-PAN008]|uniref:AtzE family amidohydrolase n=1 Tax=Zavarzinia sp. CC-PAN008 TaxID=3243332 RepID=UPI003F749CD5
MSIDPFSPAHALAAHIRDGTVTAAQVTEAFLARIDAVNPALNAYTDVVADRARATARTVDDRLARGEDVGPLAGVPFAVKNLYDIAGLPTRAGSKINRERPAATRDAVLIERLESAGAVLLGGLNMGEFAYDFTGENAHDGACRNPHDPAHMAGGSSSGCGAATGGGMAPLSLGSDTNGSIRVPSAFCGIFGLKPTYGRLTRTRTYPFCDSLDHLGPFGRSTVDLALAYDALQGPPEGDDACVATPLQPTAGLLGRGAEGLRLAVAGGWFATDGMAEADAAMAQAAAALGITRTVEIPGAEQARAAAFLITNAETAAFHLNRLRTRADDFDPDTRDRFLAGATLPAAWLARAQRVRHHVHRQVLELFRDVDVILAPATPMVAPKVGQKTFSLRGAEVMVRAMMGVFTQPLSCIGLPIAAVPIPVAGSRLPVGIQVIAAPWREDLVLRVAAALEATGVAQAPVPPL